MVLEGKTSCCAERAPVAIAVRNMVTTSQEACPASMFEHYRFVLSFLTKAIFSFFDVPTR